MNLVDRGLIDYNCNLLSFDRLQLELIEFLSIVILVD